MVPVLPSEDVPPALDPLSEEKMTFLPWCFGLDVTNTPKSMSELAEGSLATSLLFCALPLAARLSWRREGVIGSISLSAPALRAARLELNLDWVL
jgi:hypothetical protein